MTRRALVRYLAGAISAGATGLVAQGKGQYRARLSTVPIDVAMQATIAGSGAVTATLSGTRLVVSGTYAGLKSTATVAHIHEGPRGIPGPPVFDLTASGGTSGTISGTLTLISGTGGEPVEGPLLHSAAQREGPGRQPAGLAAACGESPMRRGSVIAAALVAVVYSLSLTAGQTPARCLHRAASGCRTHRVSGELRVVPSA